MAYAALCSLAQILHQTINRDYQYLILDEKQQIKSLVEKITYLQKDLSSQKVTQDEEKDIRDAAYVAEDIIESRIIERFRTESAGHEDGSTEKKLIRFDVIENWIVSSSNSASSRSGLEIVGVGGIEKPRTFQTIYGIRQLARTLRFKAWFLGSGVLQEVERTYPFFVENLHLDSIWALKRLATHGTKIVIISNSSSRGSTMDKLRRFGFDISLLVEVITSEDLRADDAWFEELGPSYNDMTSLAESEGTKKSFFTELINRKIKKFTLNFKWAWWKKRSPASPSTWHDREAKRSLKNVPQSCTSKTTPKMKPSLVRLFSTSAPNFCEGRATPKMKPSLMYKSAMEMTGVDAADHCIAVGCHLRDIKAANAAGISSIFITRDFGAIMDGCHEFADIDEVRNLAARHDARPTYVLPSFRW